MSKNTPSPPPAPDPNAVAQAQTKSNIGTATANAELNNINQASPYGSLDYSITGYNADGTPRYSQSENLNPLDQQALNQSEYGTVGAGQAALGFMPSLFGLSQGVNTSGLPGVAYSPTNGANDPGAINQAESAAFGTQENYLQPMQRQQTQQTEDQLANQGLQPGTEAYNNAMQVMQTGQNQQTQGALDAAVTAGQNEQNTLFGQGVQGAELQNAGEAQGLGQALTLQQLPLQEYGALEGMAQPTMPSFPGVPSNTVQPTDISSDIYNTYQGQLNTYDAQMASANSQEAGLFGLVGAGLKAVPGVLGVPGVSAALGLTGSDRRIKKDVEHVGHTPGGHKLFAFNYKEGYEHMAPPAAHEARLKHEAEGQTENPHGIAASHVQHAPEDFKLFGLGGKHVGVMAQEVEKKQPSAVYRRPDGVRVVDYAQIR